MKIIFSTLVGSRLYSLETESSDYDVKSVALPSLLDLLGSSDKAREHWDGEIKNPGEHVVYSITKFVKLFACGNPTITELVFADKKYHQIEADPCWAVIRNFCRTHLLTTKVIGAFKGYIYDQLERVKQKKAQNNREWMIEKHGFDIKSASHVYRLAIQASELITTETCSPTMSGEDRNIAFKIKSGQVTFEETIKLLESAVKKFNEACTKSVLIAYDKDKIEELIDNFIFDFHMEYVIKKSNLNI
jgi:predicted nucleotidyltransferase